MTVIELTIDAAYQVLLSTLLPRLTDHPSQRLLKAQRGSVAAAIVALVLSVAISSTPLQPSQSRESGIPPNLSARLASWSLLACLGAFSLRAPSLSTYSLSGSSRSTSSTSSAPSFLSLPLFKSTLWHSCLNGNESGRCRAHGSLRGSPEV